MTSAQPSRPTPSLHRRRQVARLILIAGASVMAGATALAGCANSGVGNSVGGPADGGPLLVSVAGGGFAAAGGSSIYGGDGGPASRAGFGDPVGVAIDSRGNVFVSDNANNRIRKIAATNGVVSGDSQVSTMAGDGTPGFSGDGGPAGSARLNDPMQLAVDQDNNVLVADSMNHRVRKIAAVNGEAGPTSTITTVAGDGQSGSDGDGKPATSASLVAPYGLTLTPDGGLYISDMNAQVVRLVNPAGVISTVAGTGTGGYSGDGGPATKAQLNRPAGVAVTKDGQLYISDFMNSRVRRVDQGGVISTWAGTGTPGFTGDGGPATQAQIAFPVGLDVDAGGNLYFSEAFTAGLYMSGPDLRVRRVDPAGVITTTAGTGVGGICGDGGPAAKAQLGNPMQLSFDPGGDLYVADAGVALIRKITLSSSAGAGDPAVLPAPDPVSGGNMHTIAGTGFQQYCGDGVPARTASLAAPRAVAVDSSGNVFISDQGNLRIRKIGTDGGISTVVGDGSIGSGGDGGPATQAQVELPLGVAVDKAGNLYFTDANAARVRKVDTNGIITTIAGTGVSGFSGDGGPATKAQIHSPAGIVVDDAGNIYFASMGTQTTPPYPADGNNTRIRKIATDGTITTIAGTGKPGFSGDGGPATKAQFARPTGLALDKSGDLLVVDSGNHRIRAIDKTGGISTIAGTVVMGYSGDGGPATKAAFEIPWSVTVDPAGNIFVSDIGSDSNVRKIDTAGIITTAAGAAPGGYNGENVPPASAWLASPDAVAAGPDGTIFVMNMATARLQAFKPSS